MNISIETMLFRPVVPGGAMAPPNFNRSVNPTSTKGGRLCPPLYYVSPICRPSYDPVEDTGLRQGGWAAGKSLILKTI